MDRLVILALRVVLVTLALGALAAQILIVVLTVQFGVDGIGLAHTTIGVTALACVELGLFALWVLLSRVHRGAIFDEGAYRWVVVISAAGFVAALLVAAFLAHVGELDDAPGMILIAFGVGMAGVAFALLMTVMLGLLRTATGLRHELEQVV